MRHADTVADIARTLHAERNDEASADMQSCAEAVRAAIASHQRDLDLLAAGAQPLDARLEALLERTQDMFKAMEFSLLFDVDRQLLSIGYRVADSALDPTCYDLLASEARLASFVAVAKVITSPTLVPSRTRRYADRWQCGTSLLVGIDVRILDAVLGDARATGMLARRNEPPCRAPADRIWR